MVSAAKRAYFGGLGAWNPVGAKPLVRGSGGDSPPEAKEILTNEIHILH